MKALRCDRCGAFYEYYDKDTSMEITSVALKGSCEYGRNYLIRHLDLCENCSDSLTKWVSAGKKVEQNDKK